MFVTFRLLVIFINHSCFDLNILLTKYIVFSIHSDALPEGLTRELPSADEFQKPSSSVATDTTMDDLEDLRRQLDDLNA